MATISELFDLRGRAAIITGGATGLGLQIAEGLAESGADVVLCSRDGVRCEEAARDLKALGHRALGLRCDVRDAEAIAAVVGQALAEFGKIDILVNNAGTSWGAPAESMAASAWRKVLDVNLTGSFQFCQAVASPMIAQRHGKIINVTSIIAGHGAPPEQVNAVAYSASKGGLATLTRDLACKWARYNINVNALAPGWFPTASSEVVIREKAAALLDAIPLARFGGPSDLKGAAVFLCSAASDFVTGQTLGVDGGQSAR